MIPSAMADYVSHQNRSTPYPPDYYVPDGGIVSVSVIFSVPFQKCVQRAVALIRSIFNL